ncbi:peptidoglycan-recognition protein LB-like [Ostrinia nubilalis]|uniref:peptidoglycan-recognition protein LB-like n=1 Tax=Ostrinia nubilalis TaxID=29057 RepID=UPI0030825DFA
MFLVLLISLVNFVGDIMGHPTTITDTSSENEVHTYNFPFVTRSEWHARKPKMTLPLHTPVPYVVIHHSYTPPACRSIEECENAMRVMQSMHMDGRGWWDIGYNFAVGSEGSAYEGRGWSTLGAHALHFNSVSIGICLIGDWRNELPPEDQLKTAKALIAAGVDLGYISPTYKLLGHRQVRDTECPGDALYKEIQGWAHYSPYPGSATDLLNLPEIPEKVKDVMRGNSTYDD